MYESQTETNSNTYAKTGGQFGRFVVVGLVNTGIDFIILNLLSNLTGVGIHDPKIVYLNVISFSIATTNSYFLNKHWAFEDASKGQSKQFSIFLLVSVLGAALNTAVLKFSVTLFPSAFASLSHLITLILPLSVWNSIDLTLNLAKVFATGVSLVWNFVGYKLFVFKK